MKKILTIAALFVQLSGISGQLQMMFGADSLSFLTSPLGVDSLFYWFDAGQGVTDSLGGTIATDEGVGTWNDLSGAGRHVTQTTNTDRPVYKATGGPGSKPCIQFDGTDDWLNSAAHWWGSDDITTIVVMKFANATRNTVENVFRKGNSSDNKRQFNFSAQNTTGSYRFENFSFKDGTATNYNLYHGSVARCCGKCNSFEKKKPRQMTGPGHGI